MLKAILVPATGSKADQPVFTSALTVARAFQAHLDFLHVRVDAAATAAAVVSDGSGAAMIGGLAERIDEEASQREERAKQLFQRFCESERLTQADEPLPGGPSGPTAGWAQHIGEEAYWIKEYARSSDLLVIGRPGEEQDGSLDTIERALLGSGRPLLIPPPGGLATLPETVVIAWKATAEAARAVTAAMPLLARAKQVLVITVAEEQGLSDEEGARLVRTFGWHGLSASARHLLPDRLGAADTLLAAAKQAGALVVMGAYGHSRMREWMFGGFTRHVLRGAEVPVLMMH
jgi:nucleotide-binding universal stress UspA family protein